MAIETRDVIVLGSGPGGYIAAIRASQLGKQVTVVEKESLGGVCLNWGCIPSKALLKSAEVMNELKHAAGYGINVDGFRADFPAVIERSRSVAAKLSSGVSYLMKKNKIEVIKGAGILQKGNRLDVSSSSGTNSYSFKDIIIATGARPKVIPGLPIDGEVVHTYRTILDYRKQPKSLLVIGAGAIGVEMAYFFRSMGTQVTLVEMLEQILPLEDSDIAEGLRRALIKEGLVIKTGCSVSDGRRNGSQFEAKLKSPEGEEDWKGDACLVAVGIAGNVENIGLETVGIKVERGCIEVDTFMRTNIPHHYAIGDVAGPPWLAHVASHEGLVAAEHLSGRELHGMSYENIAGCTYCQPQVASIGLTEKQAKARGREYRAAKIQFSAIGKAIATGKPEGMVKVVIDAKTEEVLGVHILHAEATELISEAAVIRSHEATASSVLETIHPHPTLSEALMECFAAALGRPLNT